MLRVDKILVNNVLRWWVVLIARFLNGFRVRGRIDKAELLRAFLLASGHSGTLLGSALVLLLFLPLSLQVDFV
jgi:hypothetical protein